eukprot:UN22123
MFHEFFQNFHFKNYESSKMSLFRRKLFFICLLIHKSASF